MKRNHEQMSSKKELDAGLSKKTLHQEGPQPILKGPSLSNLKSQLSFLGDHIESVLDSDDPEHLHA